MPNTPDREFSIFSAARRLPARERASYLDEACGDDSGLRQRVEELLDADEQAGDFLESSVRVSPQSAGNFPYSGFVAEKPGDRIGRYRLLQQIGEGGCGVVYMAEQEEPVRRRVALKVIKLGMDTKSVIARFEAERQALAMMDHPNIARALDAGATETGRPYFVMELVRGIKITDYCDQNNLSTHERLDLFMQICRAIQHAHQKGVIHRDIKPSNILVTMNDGVPLPKVIDFGIAKATHGKLTDLTLFTAFEQFIGTPAYMSPEQAELSAHDIDTRSDIYSLGVLLYELLTGRTPFDTQKLLQAGLDEIRRTIRQEEPARPSTCLTTMLGADLTEIAKHRSAQPGGLIHLIRGDLDWIVMKALEKDRSRRYETANNLALDIQRHLDNEAVTARPPSNLYQLRKLVRRNKLLFFTVAAVAAALVIGLTVSTSMFFQEQQARRQAEAEREIAETEAAKSQQVAQFLEDMLKGVGPSVALGRDTTLLREILDKTARRVGADLTNQPQVEADLRTTIGDVYAALRADPEAEAMQREALVLRQKELGPETLEAADSLEHLGNVLYEEGKDDEAETTLRESLAMRRKLQGNDNLDVARCLNDLALVLTFLTQLQEAEMADRQALAIQRKLLGDDSLEAAKSLSHLCLLLTWEAEPSEAEEAGRQALSIQRKRLGNDDPDLARTLFNLAYPLRSEGKLKEAEALAREALSIDIKINGESHPIVAGDLHNLGLVLFDEGKGDEAEQVLREAVAIARKPSAFTPPQEIPELGDSLWTLAMVLCARNQLTEARSLAQESLDLFNHHPDWSVAGHRWAVRILGRIITATGDKVGAEVLYRQQLQLQRREGRGRRTVEMLGVLGTLLQQKQNLAEAESCFREVIRLERTLDGNDAPYPIPDLVSMHSVLQAEGNLDQDEALLRDAMVVDRKYFAAEPNPDLAWVIYHLADVQRQRNSLAEAHSLGEEAVGLYRSHADWNSDDRGQAFQTLASILQKEGKTAESQELLRQAAPAQH